MIDQDKVEALAKEMESYKSADPRDLKRFAAEIRTLISEAPRETALREAATRVVADWLDPSTDIEANEANLKSLHAALSASPKDSAEAAPEKASGEPVKRWVCEECGAEGNERFDWHRDEMENVCRGKVVEVTPAREGGKG